MSEIREGLSFISGQGHTQQKQDPTGFCKNLDARTSRAVELRGKLISVLQNLGSPG